jgi:phage gp36-like protein
MAYTTAVKVRAVAIKITSTVLNDAAVGAFITNADAIINGKISARYSLPLATTPPLIETISTYVTAHLCLQALYTRDNSNTNDWVKEYKVYYDMLDQIMDGTIKLIDSTGGEYGLISTGTMKSSTQNYHTTFDMGDVEDQVVDADLITDISSERE